MARGRAAAAVVVDDDEGASGFEKWNDLQTLAVGMAWNKVSMGPASNGTSQKRDPFWELVCVAYHTCYQELGGVDVSQGKKKRNEKGCKNKRSTMNYRSCASLRVTFSPRTLNGGLVTGKRTLG